MDFVNFRDLKERIVLFGFYVPIVTYVNVSTTFTINFRKFTGHKNSLQKVTEMLTPNNKSEYLSRPDPIYWASVNMTVIDLQK
jgi:hypothetical protein